MAEEQEMNPEQKKFDENTDRKLKKCLGCKTKGMTVYIGLRRQSRNVTEVTAQDFINFFKKRDWEISNKNVRAKIKNAGPISLDLSKTKVKKIEFPAEKFENGWSIDWKKSKIGNIPVSVSITKTISKQSNNMKPEDTAHLKEIPNLRLNFGPQATFLSISKFRDWNNADWEDSGLSNIKEVGVKSIDYLKAQPNSPYGKLLDTLKKKQGLCLMFGKDVKELDLSKLDSWNIDWTNTNFENVTTIKINKKEFSDQNLIRKLKTIQGLNLILGDDITRLEKSFFSSCRTLKTVIAPSCTAIEKFAFNCCKGLEKAIFPKCERIGTSAFNSCVNLSEVDFSSCILIFSYALANSKISELNVPECLGIGEYGLKHCTDLKTLVVKKGCEIHSRVYDENRQTTKEFLERVLKGKKEDYKYYGPDFYD